MKDKLVVDSDVVLHCLTCSKSSHLAQSCSHYAECTEALFRAWNTGGSIKVQPLTSAQQIADRALKVLERLTWQSPIMSMLSMAEADLSTEIEDIVDKWKENK